ncbi:MAG: AAA family ATPase [Proteobacteria bacterium]|nr:AAA family ATPase [Pseudomonadota bacterium]
MVVYPEIQGYRITSKIYESIRSVLYTGRKTENDSKVVFKTINSDYPSSDIVSRFQYEYGIASRFDTPEVIKVHELVRMGNSYAIVMEDFGGISLDRIEAFKSLDLDGFFQLAIKTARCIGKIHQKNVIHKDVNPRNIIWNQETGEVKIIDFGICTELSQEQEDINVANQLEGSLPYISPEQTGRMNRRLDYRTDYYSLGVTCFELLTGRLPFQAKDTLGWIHCHLAKNPLDPRKIKKTIPEQLGQVLQKLMAKNAEERYQSIFGIVGDLEEIEDRHKSTGKISSFVPGRRDVSERFQISQKLYGREEDVRTLLNTFEQVSRGGSELIMVAGYSGVGKTSLVNEIQKPIVQRRGYFIEGKFDQFERDVPYRAIFRAFQNLVRQILCESSDRLESWKKRLLEALGPNGRIITDIIPDLEQIIGSQPVCAELNPVEAQNRFMQVFRDFVSQIADEQCPLVIFLDDLQWSDTSTLSLIQSLIAGSSIRHLLIIGAYRSNEVNESHPLSLKLDEIEKAQPVHRLFLNPLSEISVNQVVSDTLNCDLKKSRELSRLLHTKTAGNPFFLNELLKNLYRDGSLFLKVDEGSWDWDIEKIDRESISRNVVDLMLERLRKLVPSTQHALRMAACIGNVFDLPTLSTICEQSPKEIHEHLWSALKEDLIIPLNDRYKLIEDEENIRHISYRFQHDRVQQAAYALIEEDRKRQVHLSIGRLLLKQAEENRIVEIVRHLNEGKRFISEKAEKLELATLNLRAGKKAKASIAFSTALQHFSTGAELMPADSWHAHYELMFSLMKERMECAYLSGGYEQANTLGKEILARADSNLDRARIRHLQLLQFLATGEADNAISMGIEGLDLLGIKVSFAPSPLSIVKESLRVKWYLGKQKISDLERLPVLEDPVRLMAMKLLGELGAPVFTIGNKRLLAFIVMKQINISLRFGISTESAFAFAIYGLLLSATNRFETGYEFGKLGVAVNERFNDPQLQCRTLFIHTYFVHIWNHHLKTTRPLFNRIIEAGLQNGDLSYLGYAASQITKADAALNLPEQIKDGEKHIAIINENSLRGMWYFAIVHQQFRLNQAGLTHGRFSLETDSIKEADLLKAMEEGKLNTPLAVFWLQKLIVNQSFGNLDEARKCLTIIENYQGAYQATLTQVEYTLFSFLLLVDLHPKMGKAERKRTRKNLRKLHRQMMKWADHCPVNFAHGRYLMEAELARLSGNASAAFEHYDQAIQEARDNEFLRYEALGNERAAEFCRDLKKDKFADLYLGEALYCYQRYGAIAKVRFLEEKHPQLPTRKRLEDSSFPTTLHATPLPSPTMAGEVLDLETVVKASQALSGEMVLEKLLRKLLLIAQENAGAEKGIFVLREIDGDGEDLNSLNGKLRIQAESIPGREVEAMHSRPLKESDRLSLGLVQFVSRSRETIVLGDAASRGSFTEDPYIKRNRPKSVLCMPVINQGRLVGILYLENNMVTDVFTPDRTRILGILSSQAAISIENAQLYYNLEEKVKERTTQLEAAQKENLQIAFKAGMSEVATNILHTVGNTLNGVNIPASLALKELEASELESLARIVPLLEENRRNLGEFIAQDEKGKIIPEFIAHTIPLLLDEHSTIRSHLGKIMQNIASINDIIQVQQSYVGETAFEELLHPSEILEDAVRLSIDKMTGLGITIEKRYEDLPGTLLNRHKLMFILINLLDNAVDAFKDNGSEGGRILLQIRRHNEHKMQIEISDNGAGIDPSDLDRIFQRGFTSKAGSHGLGLHGSANAATEMSGSLKVFSHGKGKGAEFVLEIPLRTEPAGDNTFRI